MLWWFEQYLLRNYTMPKHYLAALVDTNAAIVKIETDTKAIVFDTNDVIGKNWFEIFVDSQDQAEAINAFQKFLNGESGIEAVVSYDIKSNRGKHEYMNFKYETVFKENQKFILLLGTSQFEI